MKRKHWFLLAVVAVVALASLVIVVGRKDEPLGFNLDDYCTKSWYGVYINNNKSGHAVAEISKITHNGRPAYKAAMAMTLQVAMMGQTQTIEQSEYQIFYASGEMAECFTSLGEQSYHAVVKGGNVEVTTITGGHKRTKTQPAPNVTLADQVAPLTLLLSNPEPGDSSTNPAYDPMLGTLTTTTVFKGKRTVTHNNAEMLVYDIESTIVDTKMTIKMLMTEKGEVLQLTIPAGLLTVVAKIEDEKTAKDLSAESSEMLDASLIKPTGEAPRPSAAKVRMKITGLADEDSIINNDQQTFKKVGEGEWEVTVLRGKYPPDAPDVPVRDQAVAEFLKSTELYQSDHPKIVAKARELTGEMKNSARITQTFALWVFTNVKKEGLVTFSNALETLNSMTGDCGEHAALFVALCRAAGVPARVANGIAYVKALGGFGGHAWAEVYIGRWVAVDPTFGEPVANPLRVKLSSDDLLEATRLLTALRDMKIEFLPNE